LAVEEPVADDERDIVGARLVVNTVGPVAQQMLERLVARDDPRASEFNREVLALRNAEGVSDWPHAREAAERLIGWIIDEARTSAPEVVEQGV
jgi:hypothetical protein